MGWEERLNWKMRVCKHCKQEIYTSAKKLKRHAALCKRAQAAGLVLPREIGP